MKKNLIRNTIFFSFLIFNNSLKICGFPRDSLKSLYDQKLKTNLTYHKIMDKSPIDIYKIALEILQKDLVSILRKFLDAPYPHALEVLNKNLHTLVVEMNIIKKEALYDHKGFVDFLKVLEDFKTSMANIPPKATININNLLGAQGVLNKFIENFKETEWRQEGDVLCQIIEQLQFYIEMLPFNFLKEKGEEISTKFMKLPYPQSFYFLHENLSRLIIPGFFPYGCKDLAEFLPSLDQFLITISSVFHSDNRDKNNLLLQQEALIVLRKEIENWQDKEWEKEGGIFLQLLHNLQVYMDQVTFHLLKEEIQINLKKFLEVPSNKWKDEEIKILENLIASIKKIKKKFLYENKGLVNFLRRLESFHKFFKKMPPKDTKDKKNFLLMLAATENLQGQDLEEEKDLLLKIHKKLKYDIKNLPNTEIKSDLPKEEIESDLPKEEIKSDLLNAEIKSDFNKLIDRLKPQDREKIIGILYTLIEKVNLCGFDDDKFLGGVLKISEELSKFLKLPKRSINFLKLKKRNRNIYNPYEGFFYKILWNYNGEQEEKKLFPKSNEEQEKLQYSPEIITPVIRSFINY